MAAQLITVRLSRGDAQPWGFRLQGGADFGTPLVVQKVNGGSLADQAGLMPGDAVIKINDMDIFPLRHKDAQDLVVRSGNTFVMSVQRGGSTWRPHVTPTGQLPGHQTQLGNNISTVTRTSLAHKQPQPVEHIGCGYNNAARPFNSINGGDGHVKSIVNKQYNTPVGIYSEEAIAETLSAQAEVLAGGVLGVNFKKNEKEYNPTNSEVLKFLKEEESHPQEPEPYAPANFFWTASHAIGGRKSPGHPKTPTQQTDERVGTPLEQNTLAPNAAHRPSLPQNLTGNTAKSTTETISAPVLPSWKSDSSFQQQQQTQEEQQTQSKTSTTEGPTTKAGLPQCDNCGIGIVGVFCRIKDKNLHVECFKCATCGTPLKNQGYYNYNNKLYCDVHAKLAAMQHPPPGTEGYIPIPIKPTPKLSASNIANALNAHGYNLQTNGATPSLLTGPVPPSSNHEQNITSSANPLQVSHSRASSSSSTSSGTTGKSSSCLSSLSQQSCTSLDKFLPGHNRQSSLGGGVGGTGGVGNGIREGTGIEEVGKDRIDGIIQNLNGSKNLINYGSNISYNHPSKFQHNNQQSTFNSPTNLSLSIPTPPPLPPQPTTISNNQLESKLAKNSINFEQNSAIKSTMNNNNNIQNENDINTNSNGLINQPTNTYNQFLNKYSNKNTNGADGHMNNIGTGIDSQRAISPFPNIPFPPESDDPMYGKISPFPTIPPPINQQMQYVTLQGNVIRSVIPPGKGISVDYKVGSHGGPRPFNQGPMSPQMSGPRSPAVSYPPQQQQQQQQQQQNWAQQPKSVGQSPYATLPRTNVSQQQGRYTNQVYKQPVHNFNREEERQTLVDSSDQICRQKDQHPDHFEDAEVAAVNTVQRNTFEWPPKNLQGHNTPTAAPLYIPPPETQHVIAKPLQERIEQKQANFEQDQEQELVQQQTQQYQTQWQSRSAPQLTSVNQQVELESSSDSYTSTSTTTTTTSEEYNRMYQAQVQAYQMQQMYDQQSGSEIDYHMDMEVAATQQNQEQLYSSSDFMTYHTGRRSAQECVDSLSGTLSTYKLIDLVREVTPSPTPMNKPGKRVEFADNVMVKEHESEEFISQNQMMQDENIGQEPVPVVEEEIHPETYSQCEKMYVTQVDEPTERLFPPTPKIDIEVAQVRHIPPTNIPNPIPKEWINPMVRALTIAPDKPVEIHPSCEFYCGSTECDTFCTQYSEESSRYKDQEINNVEEKPIEPEILQETPPRGTFITRVMATAPTETYKFYPNPIESVPLPEETEPYMPAPIDMKPYVREDFRPKSPFLSALITAPDRSYTPFGHDVCSQLLDLPTPKEKLTMKDALVTAPDISYSNLDPENILKLHLDEQSEKKDFIFLTADEQKIITEKKIEENLEEHMDRQISAFATLSGYRPVKPFQIPCSEPSVKSETPRNSLASLDQQYISNNHRESIQSLRSIQNSESTYNKKQIYPNNNYSESFKPNKNESQYHHYQPNTVSSQISSTTNNEASKQSHETIATSITSTSSIATAEQKISYPPAQGPTTKKTVSSGLHKPDNIPQYQRNWTMLQSQRPVRTPEPDELKQNVPLAFVDAPVEKTPTRNLDVPHKNQHHLLRGVSPTSDFSGSVIVNPHITGPITNNQSRTPKQTVPKSVPLIIEERVGPITMTFQSLDDIPDDRSQSSMSRAYTPSLSNKPPPIIPYYQTPEKLVYEECPSVESRPYDRRSASPFPDRARSPAPGPPPNPLKTIAIHAPRVKENEPNLTVPRTPQAGSITTGQSYLGTQMAQQKQQGQILSHYETASQANVQSYTEKPEIVHQQTVGDKNIQTKQNESRSMEEQKSEMESKTTTQVGNAQIERRRKVVEEYEHTQSAKTVEIRTQVGKTGFVANQARRLSELDQEISSVAKQSRAISARANNLDIQETKFPEIKSPLPHNSFPLKPVFPPHDEPHEPTYVVPASSNNKLVGPPPGFLQRYQPKHNQQESAAVRSNIETSFSQSSSYAASSVSQSSSLAAQKSSLTSTNSSFTNQDNLNSKLISAIPVAAFKPPMLAFGSNNTTNSNTKTQEQIVGNSSSISNNTYRPTASTGPAGFKPTQPGAYKTVQSNQAPMPSFEPSQQQQQAQPQPSLASNLTNLNVNLSESNNASAGPSGGNKGIGGTFGATSAPKRGRGTLNQAVGPGGRIPTCGCCGTQIRGPFITALGRIWCPEHFMCVNGSCRRPLQDIGFVEEKGDLYCEYCFEKYLAPTCSKCNNKIKGDCLNAIGRHFHPECFTCAYCGKLFGNTPFFLEEGEPYCETDWNELFTTKCYACGFPVEAGDRWVEALNHNYHSQCFNCTMCKKNLEGTSFYNKGGRPFCKNHAR